MGDWLQTDEGQRELKGTNNVEKIIQIIKDELKQHVPKGEYILNKIKKESAKN